MIDLYHDIKILYIVDTNKQYNHRALSKTQIYQQVYEFIGSISYACWYFDLLATTVYSIMTDLYHDINPIYRGYQQTI